MTNPTIRLINYSAPLDIEVIRFSTLQKRVTSERLARAHRADFYHLIIVTKGAFTHLVDFVDVLCQAGNWLLIKVGQVHAFDVISKWDGWLVVFKPEALPMLNGLHHVATNNDIFELLPTLIDLPADAHLAGLSIIEQMHRDAQKYDLQSQGNFLQGAALQYLLARLQIATNQPYRPNTTSKSASDRFIRFKKLVENKLHIFNHVHHYANALGCSEKTLNRAVLDAAGINAKSYLTQRMVLQAKRLLVHTTQPIGAIAIDLGFDEATNFVKFFKRETGMAPLAFRQIYVS